MGEDVLQGLQPQSHPVGYGEPAGREERTDLPDGLGDGGTVHGEEFGEDRVRQLVAQKDQGDQQPVGKDQLRLEP